MTLTKSLTFASVILAILATALVLMYEFRTQPAYGSAPVGQPATIATTSNPTVTTTAGILIATSSCTARIITTYASPVMLTFSDYANQTPTATFGHLQPASTTVAYDSGQYGCGLVKAYSFVSQAITVSDAR